MRKIFILIIMFAFFFGFVYSQKQEEKDKVKKEKVITNQTLKELKGKISIVGREEEATEERKEEFSQETKENVVKDEKYWRGLKIEIEERMAQASKKVENLKEEINSLYREFYSMDDPARRDQIQVKIVESTRKLEEAEQELEKAKRELEEFRERARKEGALPGWIR